MITLTQLLYNIIIFPLEKIIELNYLLFYRIFRNPAVSLLGISFSINLLTLPLYFCAEKWQRIERETQKRLSGKIAQIKKVFSGDTRYMILSTYYRQNHYHPVYALRSSFGLLIQIPFFIAAYSFLTRYDVLQGLSFFILNDLSRPDALIHGRFNLLPIIMTLINCASCMVYTKDFPVKEKIQLYGMAAVFLLLLYNSAAGLVIYWTMNNIFSLGKNILQRSTHAKKIIYFLICSAAIFLIVFALFFHRGVSSKRFIFICAVSTMFFIPLIAKLFALINRKIEATTSWAVAANIYKYFFIALSCLFLLSGVVIPVSLISSSVPEFSFIESYSSPFSLILTILAQAIGIFLFWPLCIYFIFPQKIRIYLTGFTLFLLFGTLINTFLFPGSYGFLTNTLILSDPGTWLSYIPLTLLNLVSIIALLALVIFLFGFQKGRNIIFSIAIITFVSLLSLGIVNSVLINREFRKLAALHNDENYIDSLTPIYNLSNDGRNVAIIMLDKAMSGFCPYIFEEKPELCGSWTGFTWYPNCVSFGGCTIYGLPSLLGGYAYTPLTIQQNPKSLTEKITEAILLIPRLFSDSGYKTVVTDAWYNLGGGPDLHAFDPYPEITGKNINAAYTGFWLREHPDVTVLSISNLLTDRLIKFSLFRTAPLILRQYIYDRGNWLTINNGDKQRAENKITHDVIGSYAALDLLPALTSIDSGSPGHLMIACNMLTHDAVYLQFPEYIPETDITDRGNGIFANIPEYHVNMAAYLLLGKWFDYLKENNVYDNTRIIIASDHGHGISIDPHSSILPDGSRLERFTPLLLIKDFNDNGSLIVDNSFMTHADIPLLAIDGIIHDPVNPFTGLPLINDKENGVTITNSIRNNVSKHKKNTFIIGKNEWLSVYDNIFVPENWERTEH